MYTNCEWLKPLGVAVDLAARPVFVRGGAARLLRFRLAKIKNVLNVQMVRRYRDKKGCWKVAGTLDSFLFKVCVRVFEAGGRDLSRSSAYPVGLGLKVGALIQSVLSVFILGRLADEESSACALFFKKLHVMLAGRSIRTDR